MQNRRNESAKTPAKTPGTAPVPPAKPTGRTAGLLRGMKDILPPDQPYWRQIAETVQRSAENQRYERIDTPVLEEAWLFTRGIGKETDIVEKEMFQFVDRNGDSIALRPELTAPVARAYIEHGFVSQPQPVKLYYFCPLFRHDRPQAGRYRQFWQFGFEVLGDSHPIVDAQLIQIAFSVYQSLKLPVRIQINSIGDSACRPLYLKALTDYYRSRKNVLCEDCKKRLLKNPLRLLDCKVEDCRALKVDAPQTVDHLCEACQNHFVAVLEYLDELDVPYTLNPRIVRGLDYYTRTTFEVWTDDQPEGASVLELGGGGRYDGLVEQLGGRPTPGIGFAGGVERLISLWRERSSEPLSGLPEPDVFLAQLGDPARKLCLKLLQTLRQNGLTVADSLSKDGIKTQLEAANRVGAKFALIVGQKEIMDGTVLIRDMENGIQEVVDYQKAVTEVAKRLSRGKSNGKSSEGVAFFSRAENHDQ